MDPRFYAQYPPMGADQGPLFGALGMGAGLQRQRFAWPETPPVTQMGQAEPQTGGVEPFIDPMTGLPANEDTLRSIGRGAYNILNMPADLARRNMEQAGSLQQGGSYDAGPAVEAALATMGGTSAGGVSATLGAGPARGGAAKFPRYAEEYPAVAPPVMQTDKATGKQFLGKGSTPETQAFEKERGRVTKEMREQGYVPYFNPEERFYPDPSKYPKPNVDTLTLKPTRQDTIDKYLEVIDAPQTRQNLRDAYGKGLELGNAEDWYAMGQLEKQYIKEFGAKVGRQKFMDEFAVPMAATTSGNNPPANFLMAQYLEYLRKNDLPMPKGSYELPVTVGGRRAATNVQNYEQTRERGGYSGLGEDQPKMHNFARSFMGDLSRGVMDEQMTAGMLSHAKDPGFADRARKQAFGLLERPLHDEAAMVPAGPGRHSAGAAASRGVQPGNYQDVAWAGFKGESAGPMINVINDAIERTHRLTGMPKDEIVRRGLIRKEIPIYALGALAPAGMLAGTDYGGR